VEAAEEAARRQRSLRRLGEGSSGGLGWAEKRKRDFIIFGEEGWEGRRGSGLGAMAMAMR
jgi:hypothetical protein